MVNPTNGKHDMYVHVQCTYMYMVTWLIEYGIYSKIQLCEISN